MRTIAALALVISLAACGQPSQQAATYPPQYELNFMRSCQAQGAPAAFCTCTWDKVESEIPPADFAAFEGLTPAEQETHPIREQLVRYADECRNEAVGTPEDPPPP